MDKFEVESRLGKLLFTYDKGRVKVTGSRDALADWNYHNSDVLYGAFGHIFNPDNCSVCDVYEVLVSLYGSDRIAVSGLTKERCKRELRLNLAGFIP